MRIALLQTTLNSASRSASIQSLIRAIRCAAKTVPAPDLLVLPGACDTGGVTPGRRVSDACLASVREMIAWEARDWGVYIAAGVHYRLGSALVPRAVLFDPDGDLILQDPPNDAETDRPEPVGTHQTAVGPLCVFEPSPERSRADRLASIEGGVLITMPLRPKSRGVPPPGVPKVEPDAFWAVVAPACYNPALQDECGWGTFVRDPQGETIARADNCDETIVYAEVPLELVSPDE